MSQYKDMLKEIIKIGNELISEYEVTNISKKSHKNTNKVKKFHKDTNRMEQLLEEIKYGKNSIDKNSIELYSKLFISYCNKKVGGITLEFLTNCIIERFDSMENFFECCIPYYYITDALGLENSDKSSPKYIYWNEFNKAWRSYLKKLNFSINKHGCCKTPLKKGIECKSIW